MSPSFYVVDASAYIFRSFYATPPLTNSEGIPTNALFGFLKVLNVIVGQCQPDYLVIVFDPGGKNFRHEMYPDYKANRKPIAEELRVQLPLVKEAVEVLGIPTAIKAGFEADDLLGTIAKRASSQDCDVFIVTEDKDIMQLIDNNIKMYKYAKKKIINQEDMLAETSLTPKQFIDFLALAGDTSDNVPGVRSVGPKTATKLLLEYGSLEGIYANIDKITAKKLKENLLKYREDAFLSHKLVTIDCDVSMDIDMQEYKFPFKPKADVTKFFEKYNLKTLRYLLDPSSSPTQILDANDKVAEEVINGEYVICQNTSQALAVINELSRAECWAFDLETDSLQIPGAQIVGISFCKTTSKAVYIPILSPEGQPKVAWQDIAQPLKQLFSNDNILKVAQNSKFDKQVLRSVGIEVSGVVFDTMIAAWLLNPSSRVYKLDALVSTYLHLGKTPTVDLIGKGKKEVTMDTLPVAKVGSYACEDVDACLRLYEVFKRDLQTRQLLDLFTDLEMPLVDVLMDMEYGGVALDIDILKEMGSALAEVLTDLTQEIYLEASQEFNLNSPKQLGEILFEKMGIKAPKKTKTGYSTNVSVLTKLAKHHEICRLMLEYRSYAKLQSTYIEALPELINPYTNRLHTSFMQTGTETGRLSCRNPNLQNIPIRTELGRSIRRAFIPSCADKVLIAADYSQIELRVLAHFSKDAKLVQAFNEDLDIHTLVASQVCSVPLDQVTSEQRRNAKAVNFGIIYGQQAFGLAQETGMSRSDAQEFIDAYFNYFSSIKTFIDSTIEDARKNGLVTTMSGRQRVLNDINATNKNMRAFAERTAVNTVIQGSAADLIKRVMVDLHRARLSGQTNAEILIQIHDELVFEVPKNQVEQELSFIKNIMESVGGLDVPLKVSISAGLNWMDIK